MDEAIHGLGQPNATECPQPVALEQFACGKLDDGLIDDVGEHLDRCESCLQKLEELKPTLVEQVPDTQPGDAISIVELHGRWEQFQASAAPEYIGKYRNEGILAKGGMSVVYHSTHPALGRPVAIKSLPGAMLLSQKARQCLIAEQQLLGSIQHPSIVSALDADIADGVPYIVMERVDGQSLDEYRKERGPLSPIDAAAIGAVIADALAALHAKDMVHRDVKPANICIADDGTVKLLDLGLAYRIGGDTSEALRPAGTRTFMPPEQSDPSRITDHRSDLYSLGATVLHLMAKAPLQSERAIPRECPKPLRALLAELLTEEPDRRPQDAALVAERFYKVGRSSKAIAVQHLQGQSNTLAKKTQALIGLVSIVLLVCVVAFAMNARDDRPIAGHTVSSWRSGQPMDANYPRPFPKIARWNLAGTEFACFGEDGALRIYGFSKGKLSKPRTFPCFQSTNCEFPILHWLSGDTLVCGASISEPLVVINATNGQILHSCRVEPEVAASTIDLEQQRIVFGCNDGSIKTFSFQLELVSQHTAIADQCITALDLAHAQIAAVTAQGTVGIAAWDRPDDWQTAALGRSLHSVKWHPQQPHLYVGDDDGQIVGFQANLKPLKIPQFQARGIVSSLEWNSDATQLAVGSWDASVFDANGRLVSCLNESATCSWSAFSWHDNQLLMASFDAGLVCWDSKQERPVTLLNSSLQQVLSIAWHPNSTRFAVSTMRGDLFLFDTDGSQLFHHVASRDSPPITELSWSADGQTLLGVHEWSDSVLLLDDSSNLQHVSMPPGAILRTACWVGEGRLAVGGESGVVSVFDSATNQIVGEFGTGSPTVSLRYHHESRQLLATGGEGNVLLLTLDADGTLSSDRAFDVGQRIYGCDWAKDGTAMVVSTANHQVLLVEVASGKVVTRLDTPSGAPRVVAFSPNGNRVAVGDVGALALPALSKTLPVVFTDAHVYAWSADGGFIAAGNWLEEVSLYALSPQKRSWSQILPHPDKSGHKP